MRAALAAPLLALAACPSAAGIPCGDAGTCPVNDLCIYGQCEAPGSVLQNLSAVVYPADPSLASQQFLPSDLAPVSGYYILDVEQPQQLVGHVSLPVTCFDGGDGGAQGSPIGYPVLLHFEAPTLIPSVVTTYDFIDNGIVDAESGDGGQGFGEGLIGVLPSQLTFAQRITPAAACTSPLTGTHDVEPGALALSQVVMFPDAGALIVSGIVNPKLSADVLPQNIAVRILQTSGPQAGQALSAEGTLALTDAGFFFSLPSNLPAVVPYDPDAGCDTDAGCALLTLELGPSDANSDFPVIDLALPPAPLAEVDGQAVVTLTGSSAPTLPIPVGTESQYSVTVTVSDALGLLPSNVTVDIATTDGGLWGCDGGCSFDTQRSANPSFVIDLLPGDYVFTLEAPPPDGSTSLNVVLRPDGGLATAGSVSDGGVLELVAASPQNVSGTALKPVGAKGTVVGGQAEVLTLPDLTPVALQGLDAGTFELLVPPGPNYLLLIEPANGTAFAAYRSTLSVQAGQNVVYAPFHVPQANVLSGVVRLLPLPGASGQEPLPLPNALIQFYSVTSDPTGEAVAFPVASAITDAQGNWSALGPTAE